MRAWAIILAAGEGQRLSKATGGVPKQFLLWKGAPLYWHAAKLFSRCARIAGLVFVFPADSLATETARLQSLDNGSLGVPWQAVAGGARRQDSVRHGLAAVRSETVLIHDTARPFATPELVNRVLDALAGATQDAPGVIPGIVVTDTIKIIRNNLVEATPDRTALRAVQTPQGFRTEVLTAAHARAQAEGWTVTDDAALLELCGHAVRVVEGEPGNLKITHPEDLQMLFREPAAGLPSVGFGYDVHKYGENGRPMRLGGVAIPNAPGVLAHSDGDVLLHALADALLGCCGEGDIGGLFPDTDPAWDNVNSAVIVDAALERLRGHGMELAQADLTVIAQTPKVSPFREEIRRNIARLLGLAPARVNVKATTEEGLGFTGAKQGIKAVAVATAVRCAAAGDVAY